MTKKEDVLFDWMQDSSKEVEMFISDLLISKKEFSYSNDVAKDNTDTMPKTRLILSRTLNQDRDYFPSLKEERLNIENLSEIIKAIRSQKSIYIKETAASNVPNNENAKLFDWLAHSFITAKENYTNKRATQSTQKALEEGLIILNKLKDSLRDKDEIALGVAPTKTDT